MRYKATLKSFINQYCDCKLKDILLASQVKTHSLDSEGKGIHTISYELFFGLYEVLLDPSEYFLLMDSVKENVLIHDLSLNDTVYIRVTINELDTKLLSSIDEGIICYCFTVITHEQYELLIPYELTEEQKALLK
jgi:hypothetical protein